LRSPKLNGLEKVLTTDREKATEIGKKTLPKRRKKKKNLGGGEKGGAGIEACGSPEKKISQASQEICDQRRRSVSNGGRGGEGKRKKSGRDKAGIGGLFAGHRRIRSVFYQKAETTSPRTSNQTEKFKKNPLAIKQWGRRFLGARGAMWDGKIT